MTYIEKNSNPSEAHEQATNKLRTSLCTSFFSHPFSKKITVPNYTNQSPLDRAHLAFIGYKTPCGSWPYGFNEWILGNQYISNLPKRSLAGGSRPIKTTTISPKFFITHIGTEIALPAKLRQDHRYIRPAR